ncbi:MAG: sigma-70 family RNA polymerase sigma factor [Atribacterota bacterium]|jgi:RNA polymerase sigma-70 factor (ECF subfamily)|nr:sigma-70 family RNA polymerase sigma factor [Atribacterota bacterium]
MNKTLGSLTFIRNVKCEDLTPFEILNIYLLDNNIMPHDDLKMIEACLLGNTQAFSGIINKYKGMVYNLAYRMCGNIHDSEDIAQEAFVKAYQSLSHYNSAFRFSTWLYQITLNVIRDRMKRKNIDSISLDTPFPDGRPLHDNLSIDGKNNPEEQMATRERVEGVQRAIMSLPLQYREIIVLRHLQDLSYRELASILKVSPDTVKIRLYRAREQLKSILKKN